MKNKKIVVLMGGPSKEADVSRRTGNAIAAALQSKGYRVDTLELCPQTVIEDIKKIDGEVVFNAVHGLYGEDGALQGLLEMAQLPYTGSGLLANAIGMNKNISKAVFAGANIPTAFARTFDVAYTDVADIMKEIQLEFSLPVVVKAPTQGSSIGVVIVKEWNELDGAIKTVLEYGQTILVESYLDGGEFTVSVLNGTALPVIQIKPHSGVYDYASKYTKGSTEYLVPAPIEESLSKSMQAVAETVYRITQSAGLIRVDFMTDRKDKIYVLEINTVPGMTETSLAPKAAAAKGIDFPTLCEEILATASLHKY